MNVSSKVGSGVANEPIADYLSRRFTYLVREDWVARIGDGRIAVNGTMAEPATAVRAGDVVSYELPDFAEPPADLDYRIVYEDGWILGVDKPGNLLVHRHGRSFRNNLIYQLRYVHVPPYANAGIVNRLDRETSGVVLVALDQATLVALNVLFASGKVEKEYLAITTGIPSPRSGTIDRPIGRGNEEGKFMIDLERGKAAVTHYRVADVTSAGAAVVRLRPVTGRTHQLRVHLASIGCPILGDKVYGRPGRSPTTLIGRHALHCQRVSFVHPWNGSLCEVGASLPIDMLALTGQPAA